MDTYHRISAAVAPKRVKLHRTEAILAAADAQLREKQDTLRVRPCSNYYVFVQMTEDSSESGTKHAAGKLTSPASPCREWRSELRLCSCN